MNIIKKMWLLLSSHQRKIIIFLIAAMLIGSVLEAVSLGLIVPLINLISNQDAVQKYAWLVRAASRLHISNPRDITLYYIYALLILFILKSVYVIKLSHFQLSFTANTLYSLSSRLLKAYLVSPWTFHLQRNPAELMNNIITQAEKLCTGLINSLLIFVTELFITFSITMLLILMDPVSTLIALFLIGSTSLGFYCVTRRKIEWVGSENQKFMTKMIKTVNEAFGGIKETKVLGREDFFVRSFTVSNRAFTRSWIYVTLIGNLQRSVVELLFVSGIIVMSLIVLYRGQGASHLLSILALFAAAAFRLMPSVNRINVAMGTIKYYKPALDVIYREINTPNKNHRSQADSKQSGACMLTLQDGIKLQNVHFRYPGAKKEVINSINVYIPKGFSVGFIGPSGAGKTTVVDIILGLLKPDSGNILVDGHDIHDNLTAWQKLIGYIPQNIYLSDDTIRRNVAFGLDDDQIVDAYVWSALKSAQLSGLIEESPEGLNTMVGERGIRLSGGQRQRIGIARALYHNPELLVMDEATSSLDSETEREISNAIDRLSGEKTLIIIAHRINTVEKCNIVYEVKNGKVLKKNTGAIFKRLVEVQSIN